MESSYRPRIPVPLLMIAGALAGALIASAARRPLLRAPEPLRTRYFGLSALVGVGLFMPAGLLFMMAAPAWSMMYLVHPAHVSAAVLPVGGALALAAAPAVGFALEERLLSARRAATRQALMWVAALLFVALAVMGRRRILALAHYDDFHLGGPTVDFVSSWLIAPSLLTVAGVVTGVVLVVRSVRDHQT